MQFSNKNDHNFATLAYFPKCYAQFCSEFFYTQLKQKFIGTRWGQLFTVMCPKNNRTALILTFDGHIQMNHVSLNLSLSVLYNHLKLSPNQPIFCNLLMIYWCDVNSEITDFMSLVQKNGVGLKKEKNYGHLSYFDFHFDNCSHHLHVQYITINNTVTGFTVLSNEDESYVKKAQKKIWGWCRNCTKAYTLLLLTNIRRIINTIQCTRVLL